MLELSEKKLRTRQSHPNWQSQALPNHVFHLLDMKVATTCNQIMIENLIEGAGRVTYKAKERVEIESIT